MSPRMDMMTVSKYSASGAKFSVGPFLGAYVFSFVLATYYGHAPTSIVLGDITKPLHSSSAIYSFTMPAQRSKKRASKVSSLPDDPLERRKVQNRINKRNSRVKARQRQAAEEAKAHEAAGLTEPVRDTEDFEEPVVEREVSTQSETPHSPSEGASSSPPKRNTVMDKVPESEKRIEWDTRSGAAIQYPGYAQTDLRSMSHDTKNAQPLQVQMDPPYPVFCHNCAALPYSPEPWYSEAARVDHVDTFDTLEQPIADRLKSLTLQLINLQ